MNRKNKFFLGMVVMLGSVFFVNSKPLFAATELKLLSTSTPALRDSAVLYERADDEFASAIVIDPVTNKVLYSYLPHKTWPAASLTKLMNALVVVDQKPQWSKTVSFSSKDFVGGGQLNVKTGSRITLQNLLYSSIIGSANNAAVALARTSTFGLSGFIEQMNKKAEAMGLTTSTFFDPSGLDPRNITTAAEMAVIAAKAYKTPEIRRPATTASYGFYIGSPSVKKVLKNTNNLLTKDDEIYVLGGKTGFLYESRYNLAVQMRPMVASPSTPPLLVVVLGAPTYAGSFAAAKGLANWAWNAYDWQSP